MKCYRVWMKDGYAGLYDGENEEEARRQAVEVTKKNIEGCAMSQREKREALTVDYVQCLTEESANA